MKRYATIINQAISYIPEEKQQQIIDQMGGIYGHHSGGRSVHYSDPVRVINDMQDTMTDLLAVTLSLFDALNAPLEKWQDDVTHILNPVDPDKKYEELVESQDKPVRLGVTDATEEEYVKHYGQAAWDKLQRSRHTR